MCQYNHLIYVPISINVKIFKHCIQFIYEENIKYLPILKGIKVKKSKIYENELCIYKKNITKLKYNMFIGVLRSSILSLYTYVKFEYFIKGKGYKIIKLINNKIIFKIGFGHLLLLTLPKLIKLKYFNRYNFNIYGPLKLLNQFNHILYLLQPVNIYNGNGLRIRNQDIKFKIGKQSTY